MSSRCKTCRLDTDTKAEILDARQNHPIVPYPVISRWILETHNKNITTVSIKNHINRGH